MTAYPTFTVRLSRASDMPLSANALPAPHLAKMRPRRILVVDDNADAARTLADWPKLEGHTVYVFFDGPSALDFAAPDHIGAFVLDIGLPGMDGREVARRLRAPARHEGVIAHRAQ